MIQPIHSAVSGLQTNAQRFAEAAHRVTTASQANTNLRSTASTAFAGGLTQHQPTPLGGAAPVPAADMTNAIVDMKTAVHGYKASLAVLAVAEEMSRVILDRKA